MRTMNQQLACSFRCARRTLHWFIELTRASQIDSLNFRQVLANRQAFEPGQTFEPRKVNLPVARESLLLDLSPIGIINGLA